MRLYRAMSEKEYETLQRYGFEATFRRRWKFFTMNAEYIGIILDEVDYGLWKGKYQVVVRFDMSFSKSLQELEKMRAARIFRERGYTTVALRKIAIPFIERIHWETIDPSTVSRPRPLLEWRSKNGNICRLYRRDKALRLLASLKDRSRILYVDPSLGQF